MCGISGLLSPSPQPHGRALIERVVASQHRRGPDHLAVIERQGPRGTAILGHNRLSIIDLSVGGRQPMWDGDERLCVVFNGEIYNYVELRAELAARGHRFRSASDTEVILEAFKAWGPRCVERFNGMFAFAIHEPAAGKLWLFRDRFGVKPLFYTLQGDVLYFASTGRALAERLALRPDMRYVARGMQYSYYEEDDEIAMYEGLRALRPGHWLEVDASGPALAVNLKRWYDLAAAAEARAADLAGLDDAALIDELRRLLQDAVALRMRADVPVGISLSGGLDSSSIAAIVAAGRPDITGFTFAHPDAPDSEGPVVAALARHTGIRVEYVWPAMPAIIQGFWEALEAQDAPFPGGSIVAQWLVFKRVRQHGVRVLLGGQGGDEVFMGYLKWQLHQLRKLARERRPLDALGAMAGLLPVMLAELGHGTMLQNLRRRAARPAPLVAGLRLYGAGSCPPGYDPAGGLRGHQVDDIMRFSLPSLLRYEDRNSMGNSVESRLPFMDYRVVELGVALPTALKLRAGYRKWILREAMRPGVPALITHARFKRGFDVGQRAWITGGLGASMREGLHERAPRLRDVMAPGTVIDRDFSDERMLQPGTVAAAITLLWLGDRLPAGGPTPGS